MARGARLRGCYQRVLVTLAVCIAIFISVGVFVFQSTNGIEGIRHWMAGYALNGVEAHLLQQDSDKNWVRKPDGVSADDIRSTFAGVRAAIAERRVDLEQLDSVLRDYQAEFQNSNPSTGEVLTFLENLNLVALAVPDDASVLP